MNSIIIKLNKVYFKGGIMRLQKKRVLVIFIFLMFSITNCQQDNSFTDQEELQQKINKLYADYDQKFNEILKLTVQQVGKETIKSENFSDRFSIPKKITITGTHYELGLTIGNMAVLYNMPLPYIYQRNDTFNKRIIEMYKKRWFLNAA